MDFSSINFLFQVLVCFLNSGKLLASTASFGEDLHRSALPVWRTTCFCLTRTWLLLALFDASYLVYWNRQCTSHPGVVVVQVLYCHLQLWYSAWRILICWNAPVLTLFQAFRFPFSSLSGSLMLWHPSWIKGGNHNALKLWRATDLLLITAVPTHLGAVAETATEHWHDLAVDLSLNPLVRHGRVAGVGTFLQCCAPVFYYSLTRAVKLLVSCYISLSCKLSVYVCHCLIQQDAESHLLSGSYVSLLLWKEVIWTLELLCSQPKVKAQI